MVHLAHSPSAERFVFAPIRIHNSDSALISYYNAAQNILYLVRNWACVIERVRAWQNLSTVFTNLICKIF